MKFHYRNRKPRILITGVQGQLAPSIITELDEQYELHFTDKNPSPSHQAFYRQADLRDFSQVLSLMEGMEAVIHLAIARNRNTDESDFSIAERKIHPMDEMNLQVNLMGTFNVFEAAKRAGVARVVFASSLTVHYGNKNRPHYDCSTMPDPKNLYACAKLFGENLGRLYSRESNISVICLRFGHPYPLGIKEDELWRTSKRARSAYVTLKDMARSVRCAVETPMHFGIYHVVSASDNPRFDISDAREIGYSPRSYFSESGLTFHEK